MCLYVAAKLNIVDYLQSVRKNIAELAVLTKPEPLYRVLRCLASLHDWDDCSASLILQSCRKVMSKNSKLLIIEKVIEDNQFKNMACLGDINMLVTLTGKERSLLEFQVLLEKAEFKFIQKINTKTVFSIIEAKIL